MSDDRLREQDAATNEALGVDGKADLRLSYFVGDCTCDHEMDAHGWGSCYCVENDVECPCEAGWEE